MNITSDAEVSAVLDLAGDLIEAHGWQTGDYFAIGTTSGAYHEAVTDDLEYVGGTMCTEGAIRAADTMIYGKLVTTNRQLMTLSQVGRRAIRTVGYYVAASPDGYRSVPWWNDNECCDAEQATRMLRDVAIKTRPDSA